MTKFKKPLLFSPVKLVKYFCNINKMLSPSIPSNKRDKKNRILLTQINIHHNHKIKFTHIWYIVTKKDLQSHIIVEIWNRQNKHHPMPGYKTQQA